MRARGRRFVQWGRELFSAGELRPPLNPPPGTCVECGGLGVVAMQIDEERPDAAIACPSCRIYCKGCDRYVPKAGHECKGN